MILYKLGTKLCWILSEFSETLYLGDFSLLCHCEISKFNLFRTLILINVIIFTEPVIQGFFRRFSNQDCRLWVCTHDARQRKGWEYEDTMFHITLCCSWSVATSSSKRSKWLWWNLWLVELGCDPGKYINELLWKNFSYGVP